jgi:hypothetical protein
MSGMSTVQRMTFVTGHRWLAAVLITAAVAGLSINPCRAQCVDSSERAPQADLDTFVKSPTFLLESVRADKEKLKGRLAAYLMTNPELLPSVRPLIGAATTAERSAIGAALRIAETRCTSTKPNASRRINAFVQRLGDLAVLTGYSAAGEDQSAAPSRVARQPRSGAGLMSGEWKTELADPFKPMPLPQ